MSSLIIVVLVLNLLHILFSTVSVRSDQSVLPIRSFKIGENATYDCVDINNQPGLGHRLLQNHTIQMKPSVSRHELRNHIDNKKSYSSEIGCPDGTVPILRISNEYKTKAQLFAEKYFHPLTVDNPGTHIKPSFFGTGQLWTYGYFKGKDGKGCYNTACDGFIQVSRKVPIVQPININPGESVWSCWSIHQDKATGNWWLSLLIENAPNVDIRYWPKELFNILNNGGNKVGVAGVVQASHTGSSPPMGNGNFPVGSHKNSAMFTNIEVLDSNYSSHKLNSFPTKILFDSPKCYGIRIGKVKLFHSKRLGFFFNYGGSGGKFCGV